MNKKRVTIISAILILLGASISLASTSILFGGIHQNVRGYVRFSDGSNVPNGIIVTVTDLDNGNSMIRYTQQANGGPGFYILDVIDLGASNGDIIFSSVSYGGCEGNNSVAVNISLGPSIWSNVTIYGNLPPAVPAQPSGPTFGYINSTYNYSTQTWDSDGDDVYYLFDWGDGSNSGWVGPYISNQTCTASKNWQTPGTYPVKAKAKDEHDAELGICWSSSLSVNIVISQPPNTPNTPDPPDGATGVDVNADLSWNCTDPDGDDLTYDVYFEANDPTPDVLVSNNQSGSTYDPGTMDYSKHYYWKIGAWDEYGFYTEGPVWDFTTMSEPNDPPYIPSGPDPENGSIGIDVHANISWTGGDPDGDTVTYDVYFEADDPTPDIKIAEDIVETWFEPGKLEYETTYYWKVYARDFHGAVTQGPVWNFTTELTPEPDLNCYGSLSWTAVPPGGTVNSSFTVENIGEPDSLLDWEVIEWPDWGTWSFDPIEGYDLTPENGEVTVQVTVVAPNQQTQEFSGAIKIVNKENSSDYEIISVSLATPVSVVVSQSQSLVITPVSTDKTPSQPSLPVANTQNLVTTSGSLDLN